MTDDYPQIEDWRRVPEQPASEDGQKAIPGLEQEEIEREYRDRVGKRGKRGEDKNQKHLF